MAVPTFTVEAGFGSKYQDAAYAWTDISAYARTVKYGRGRNSDVEKPDAGSGSLVVKDGDRRFDSTFLTSPYYPYINTNVPMRVRALLSATTYYLTQQYVSSWGFTRYGPDHAERTVALVDAFSLLGLGKLQPTNATLTTTLGSNKDLKYTAVNPGANGNKVAIQYVLKSPAAIHAKGTTVQVYLGASGMTANALLAALQADSNTAKLVTVALASGSDGTGTIAAAMAATKLSGGGALRVPSELSGTRISRCLGLLSWPSALRNIATGKDTMAAFTVQPGNSVAALTHMQDVSGEGGEEGLLYIDGRGRVAFLDRWTVLAPPTSKGTFSDQPVSGEFAYQGMDPTLDVAAVVNDWSSQRDGGLTQYAKDAASILQNGPRSRQLASMLTNDADVLKNIQYRLSEYGTAVDRIKQIQVMPGADTATWAVCMGMDVGDMCVVKRHPPGGGIDTRSYYVERVDPEICFWDPVRSKFTFQLWPVTNRNFLVLNDASRGMLDYNKLGA